MGELLKPKDNTPKFRSERGEVLDEVYGFYRESTRKENWKRYVKWLRENRYKASPLKIQEFKKTKIHLKTRSIKSFCVMLAHIPTKDLYYILSIGRDKSNRKENFSGWLMGEIRAVSDNSSTAHLQ